MWYYRDESESRAGGQVDDWVAALARQVQQTSGQWVGANTQVLSTQVLNTQVFNSQVLKGCCTTFECTLYTM